MLLSLLIVGHGQVADIAGIMRRFADESQLCRTFPLFAGKTACSADPLPWGVRPQDRPEETGLAACGPPARAQFQL
jgi:hypothetical protein